MANRTGDHRFGSGAISLLKDLLKLDWRTRINAVDALDHAYFRMAPLPMEPHEIPMYEESHELDRRKFHDRKAALPPAPKGGTVGVGPDANGATAGFNSSDGYGSRNGFNGSRFRGGPDERSPTWQRERGPASRLPHERPGNRDDPDMRDRGAPRGRVPARGGDMDTYIPSYCRDDGGRRGADRSREDRRRRNSNERWNERERHPRSRSRSPVMDRRERDMYRR